MPIRAGEPGRAAVHLHRAVRQVRQQAVLCRVRLRRQRARHTDGRGGTGGVGHGPAHLVQPERAAAEHDHLQAVRGGPAGGGERAHLDRRRRVLDGHPARHLSEHFAHPEHHQDRRGAQRAGVPARPEGRVRRVGEGLLRVRQSGLRGGHHRTAAAVGQEWMLAQEEAVWAVAKDDADG